MHIPETRRNGCRLEKNDNDCGMRGDNFQFSLHSANDQAITPHTQSVISGRPTRSDDLRLWTEVLAADRSGETPLCSYTDTEGQSQRAKNNRRGPITTLKLLFKGFGNGNGGKF